MRLWVPFTNIVLFAFLISGPTMPCFSQPPTRDAEICQPPGFCLPVTYGVLTYLDDDLCALVALQRTCKYFRHHVGRTPATLHQLKDLLSYETYLKTQGTLAPPSPSPQLDLLIDLPGLFDDTPEPPEQKYSESYVRHVLSIFTTLFSKEEWNKLAPFYKIDHDRGATHHLYVKKLYFLLKDLFTQGKISEIHYQNSLAFLASYPMTEERLLSQIEDYLLTLDHCPPIGLLFSALALNPANPLSKLQHYLSVVDTIIGNHEDHDPYMGMLQKNKVFTSLVRSHRCPGPTCPAQEHSICTFLETIYKKSLAFDHDERIQLYQTIFETSHCSTDFLQTLLRAYFSIYETHTPPEEEELVTHFTTLLRQPDLDLESLASLLIKFSPLSDQSTWRYYRGSLTLSEVSVTLLRKEFEQAFARNTLKPQEKDIKDKINSLNITIKS